MACVSLQDLRQLALRSNESQWESPAAVSMQTSTYRSAEFEQLSRALVGLHEAAGSAPPLRNQAVNGLESAQTLLQTRRPHPILESLLVRIHRIHAIISRRAAAFI